LINIGDVFDFITLSLLTDCENGGVASICTGANA